MIAPEFPAHLEWLNADRRHSIKDFKGKFVLLDFWTYCCINCMHVIPELRKLEEKYPELVVVGVHSAKFHNEKIKENIAQAVLRYDIEHPIIIDNNFEIWKTYGVDSWPSFILIGPDRQIIGRASGEGIFERFDAVMEKLISMYQEAGKLNRERMHFPLLKEAAPETFLRFPGKIDTDPATRRLFISDSNHHRILIANPEGEVLDVIGSGVQGRRDGAFGEAEFCRPQGLAFDSARSCLYVADTENHLIRMADLKGKIVTTIAGSDEKGRLVKEAGEVPEIFLNSPWDLTILGEYLYIAMAGYHQIWRLNLDSLWVEAYAGSGVEGVLDGPRLKASLAQPSGITTDGRDLYFADSETSALRMIQEDVVTTLIGKGLFVFGDEDGLFPEARLQHPIGVHYHENALYVADSYNHKVKKADLRTREVTTLVGTGTAGRRDGDALKVGLNEPNDLAFLDDRLYIADTNNHAIRVYEPLTERLSTMIFRPVPQKAEEKAVILTERSIPSRSKGLHFQLMLPGGYHWNRDAEQQITVSSDNPEIIVVSSPLKKNEDFSYYVPLEVRGEGKTELKISLVGYYCDREASCCFQPAEFVLPLRIEESAPIEEITVVYRLLP
ncbi:MAG TPA: thioredoxin-like domain-containing protein [Methanotrichaceae archaeon]|nr:thioredoxin-like domain-containing protein [Methanotrichaceae archaeon]